MNINLKKKRKKRKKERKNYSNCNFHHFSLLVPWPNNFLVVCLCILIFHGIVNLNFFLSCSQGLVKFQMPWDVLCWGTLRTSIKPSMINHVNLRIVEGKIICFMCVCYFFSLLVEDFLLENFLSILVSIQKFKKMFTIIWK